ncbi:helix-turn-helix domain-containing protein [Deinococcus oregonensis]|uniref:Helix-turn-helix domain-containing protein n=1 Tax=Deinococcus oregonensis TaxID=1805970 RepID=A0ABV6B2X1_9DEIO
MRETIGTNIRNRRMELGLTMADLARIMFDNRKRESYISLVENGQTVIDVERLAEFAEALSFQPTDLLVTVSYDEVSE